jgi:hypothetical protein
MGEKLGIAPHVIEMQLGHAVGSAVSRIYNHSTLLSERRAALNAWANHLVGLTDPGGDLVMLKTA